MGLNDVKLLFVICLCDKIITFLSVCKYVGAAVFRLQVHFSKYQSLQHINLHKLQ